MESTRPPANGRQAAVIRRGTRDHLEACHRLLWESATDLGARRATPLAGSADDWWRSPESLHRYLASHDAEWWVAEKPQSRELIGYARSIERGGPFELTEFFVRPGQQSQGVGRVLLERSFPTGRGEVRSIIATTDVRALSRYYAADTVARFPMFTLACEPRSSEQQNHLERLLSEGDAAVATVAAIEREVLGFPRGDSEIRWLELEVPAPNSAAMQHLLGRGFRIDPWINLLMSSRPFGQFDRFVGYSPPIFL